MLWRFVVTAGHGILMISSKQCVRYESNDILWKFAATAGYGTYYQVRLCRSERTEVGKPL